MFPIIYAVSIVYEQPSYTGLYGMLKPGKAVALMILINLNNGRVYITQSVINAALPRYSGVAVYSVGDLMIYT